MTEKIEIVKEIAKKAGELLLRYYNQDYSIDIKNDDPEDFVTEADKKSEELIISELKRYFPEHGFLGEESFLGGKIDKDYVWVIDPMDNTKGFVKKSGDFSVQIGLCYQGKVILGIVYLPALDQMYYAEKSEGAFLNGEKIKVSSINKISKFKSMSSSRILKDEGLKKLYDKVGCANELVGGAGKKICLVAQGKIELVIYKANSAKEWDYCAPGIILTEAGGRISLSDGSEVLFNRGKEDYNLAIVASNNVVHDKVLKILKE